MATSILAIVAALIGLAVWWVKKSAAAKADPKVQNEKRYEKAESDVAKGDGVDAGANGADDLDALDRLQNGQGDKR